MAKVVPVRVVAGKALWLVTTKPLNMQASCVATSQEAQNL